MKLPHLAVTIAAALASTCVSAAVGSWVKASSGQDDSDGTGPSLHIEYVLQSSVKNIRGNYRTAYVKVTYAPGVRVMGGDVITTTISNSMVDCNALAWGNVVQMAFDASMKPILSSSGEFDTSRPVWVLKDMEKLNPSSITYRTAQYICGVKQ